MSRETPCPVSLQCLIFLLLMTPAIAIGVALMVLLLPQSPKFQVVSFQVSPITLNRVAVDDSFLLMSATWNLTFLARNPNKRLTISYNNVDVSLYYKWVHLSSQRLGFFNQCPKSKGFVHSTLVTQSARVSKQVMETMATDAQDLAVNFNVNLRGSVKVYVGSLMGKNHALSIDCDDVKVSFFLQNATGRMLPAAKGCYSNKLIF